jgi:hypothetical protein
MGATGNRESQREFSPVGAAHDEEMPRRQRARGRNRNQELRWVSPLPVEDEEIDLLFPGSSLIVKGTRAVYLTKIGYLERATQKYVAWQFTLCFLSLPILQKLRMERGRVTFQKYQMGQILLFVCNVECGSIFFCKD